MMIFLPLDILGVQYHLDFHKRIKMPFTIDLQISALVLEIFKLEKCAKYVNEITDDITHSTQYYLKYINRASLANLQGRPLKLGRLIVLQETHPQL